MFQRICNHAAMVVLGVAFGAGAVALTQGWGPAVPVDASATHGSDNFAIATGLVDNGVEAFYFLDFLTGDLRAAVVSRRTVEFVAFFERNIQGDFGGALTKNPKYLMVTGQADIPRGRGATQLGSGLVYVAEATTGNVNAYVVPWNSSLDAAGKPQRGELLNVAGGSFRTTFVRD